MAHTCVSSTMESGVGEFGACLDYRANARTARGYIMRSSVKQNKTKDTSQNKQNNGTMVQQALTVQDRRPAIDLQSPRRWKKGTNHIMEHASSPVTHTLTHTQIEVAVCYVSSLWGLFVIAAHTSLPRLTSSDILCVSVFYLN